MKGFSTKLHPIQKIFHVVMFVTFFFCIPAFATPYMNPGFWKQPTPAAPSLAFTTSAYSGVTWTCSTVTVETRNAAGVATNVVSNTTVNITGGTGFRYYSDSSCLNEVTSVVVTAGTSSKTFYFQSGKIGTLPIQAAATGYTTASQNQTITGYLGCTWIGGTAGNLTTYNTATNWSCGHVPTNVATDLVVFDSNCGTNCNPGAASANQTLYGLFMTPDYTGTFNTSNRTFSFNGAGACRLYGGTLTQGSAALSCAGGMFSVRGGTLNGGTAALTLNGGLTMSSGSIVMNASALNTLASNSGNGFQISGGTLTAGGGSITFSANAASNTFSGGTWSGGSGNLTISGNFAVSGGSFTTSSGTFGINTTTKTLTVSGGTFTQNGTIFSSGNLVVNGGTFVGTAQYITFRDITISSGSFTMSSIQTTFTRNYSATGGTIIHNSGLLNGDGSLNALTLNVGSENYYGVTLRTMSANITLTGTMNVTGDLYFGDDAGTANLNGGTFNVTGSNITAAEYGYVGTATIIAAGKASGQTISCMYVTSLIPNLTINAGTNPVTFGTNVAVNNNFATTSVGTFNVAGSTLTLKGSGSPSVISPGTAVYNNVTLTSYDGRYNLSSQTLSMLGNFTTNFDNSCVVDSGTIQTYGQQITANNIGCGGSGIIKLAGNASGQTVSSTLFPYSQFPNLVIAAGSNAVTLSTNVVVAADYTYLSSGALNIAGSTLYIRGVWAAGNNIIPGTVHYNNVSIGSGYGIYDLNGGTLNVDGTFALLNDSNPGILNNGTVMAYGNATSSEFGWDGSAVIKIAGNASGQNISTGVNGYYPNLEIVAGANNVTFGSLVRVVGFYKMTSVGTLNTSGSTLHLLGHWGTTENVTIGAETYNNVTLGGGWSSFNFNAGTFKIGGTLTLVNNSSAGNLDNGTLLCMGNASATEYSFWGSALVKIAGNASGQTVSSTSPGFFNNIEIATGTNPVTFGTTVSVRGNYTVTSVGTLTTTGSTVNFMGLWGTTIYLTFGSETYSNVVLGYDNSILDLNTTTLKAGTLNFNDNTGGEVRNGNIQATGNVSSTTRGMQGNAKLFFLGANQTLSRALLAALPNGDVTVNITGTLTLNNNIFWSSIGQALNIISGAINMNNNNLTIGNSLTMSGGTSITRGTGTLQVNGVPIGAGPYSGGTIF